MCNQLREVILLLCVFGIDKFSFTCIIVSSNNVFHKCHSVICESKVFEGIMNKISHNFNLLFLGFPLFKVYLVWVI